MEVKIRGSHGDMVCDEHGKLLEYKKCCNDPECDCYDNIASFDTKEYKDTYGVLDDDVDILDIGFTCKDGTYSEADWDWRESIVFRGDVTKDERVFSFTDQPEECPQCGARTHFAERKGKQFHSCLECSYRYVVE